MRFHLGQAPEATGFSGGIGWTPVAMPEVRRWQTLAFPVALLNVGLVAALWLLLTPAASQIRSLSFPLPVGGFVLCLAGVLVLHEFIHSWAHPRAGFSTDSVIGFHPSRMLLYSVYNGDLPRSRFLLALMMPLIVISITPILVSTIFQAFSFWLAYATILNAFVSSGDILEITTILRQVPNDSTIRRNGWRYYWKAG